MTKVVVSIRLEPGMVAAIDQIGVAGSRSRQIEAIIEAFLKQRFQLQRDALKGVRVTRRAELVAIEQRRGRRQGPLIEMRAEPLHSSSDERQCQTSDEVRAQAGQAYLSRRDSAAASGGVPLFGQRDSEGS